MSRSAQRARMEAYSARELHDTAWGQTLTEIVGRVNMDSTAITDSQIARSFERELKACGLQIVENRNV